MALKVPFAASLVFLDACILSPLTGCKLRAYSNNHAPADGDTAGSYTECTFPGYAALTLTTWSAAALDGSNKASTAVSIQTWTAGSIVTPQNVYGIYVTTSAGVLLYAELNPGGVVSISTPGQTYSYTPVFTEKSEF
jgi:hypothetical protein